MNNNTTSALVARSWEIALGHYLTNYPENIAPEVILEMVATESPKVTFWEPFEYYSGRWVAEYIAQMQTHQLIQLQWAASQTEPAALQITNVSSALASPAFTASAPASHRSAVNPCTDGDPIGWGVYCSDHNGEWIESTFQDEAAAENFAEAWRNYREDNAARVALIIANDRSEWETENINEEIQLIARPAMGVWCWIIWTNPLRKDRGLERKYISLGEYDEENNRDTFGVQDGHIFYYSDPAEIMRLAETQETTADGWRITEISEWVRQ